MTKRKPFVEFSKMGRPPKEGPKPVIINILIAPDVKEKLKELAADKELSLSAFLADHLTKFTKNI